MTEQRPWGRKAGVGPHEVGDKLKHGPKTPMLVEVWVNPVATNEWRCHGSGK